MDLNAFLPKDSAWSLMVANDINDNGWIVGRGYVDGAGRAFLLIPAEDASAAEPKPTPTTP